MLYRYGPSTKKGKRVKIATIYKEGEHTIDNTKIIGEVVFIISKLKAAGFESYLVGGAVRDLLLKKTPKDFDIATAATPNQIKTIFPNSRIIGRRFQICHLFFPSTKRLIEISTFRSSQSQNFINEYGSIYEDAFRRDFTINALYYCPLSKRLYDYVDALSDFKKHIIRSIIDLENSFILDPVRMIRAIKYSVKLNFKMQRHLVAAIKRDAHCLKTVPISRLVEEFFKIISSSNCYQIVSQLIKFNLFHHFFPNLLSLLKTDSKLLLAFYKQLQELDELLNAKVSLSKSQQLVFFFKVFISLDKKDSDNLSELRTNLFSQIKQLAAPLTLPNHEITRSAEIIMQERGFPLPKRRNTYKRRSSASAKLMNNI